MEGYGERLRTARKRRALELADVAARLKIPAKELRAVEWERLDLLSSPARAQTVRTAYEQFLRSAENGQRLSPVRAGRRGRRVLAFVLAGALAAAAGNTARALLVENGDDTPAAAPRPGAAPVAPPPAPPPQPTPAPPVTPPRINAVLTASRGDSWVEARRGSAEGPSLYEGVLRQGSTVQFKGARIWLRLGAASYVDLLVNGKPAPKLTGTVEFVLVPRSAA